MIGILGVDHVQVTVARHELDAVQLHLALEDRAAPEANRSRRHVCYRVADLAAAEGRLRDAGVQIFPDRRPIDGVRRFFVEDPGGNRIEIAAPE
jgi:catechol 2,3-dioxygenase-like lactoylglutathione lyase family enzyme